MNNDLIKIIEELTPDLQETIQNINHIVDQNRAKQLGLSDGITINGKYNALAYAYRFFACQYLRNACSLDRLDERFAALEDIFIIPGEQDKDYYQKYDGMHLKFIYMRNNVHIERLPESRILMLEKFMRGETEPSEIADLVEATYQEVLAADLQKNVFAEYFPDVKGRGIFPGNAILLAVSTAKQYDRKEYKPWELESKKHNIIRSVCAQLEELVKDKLSVTVKLTLI